MNRIVLDTNLLVLLVVGMTDRTFIAKHKRTRSFEAEDFDLLCSVLAKFDQVVVTPHIITETSNLISQIREPNRGEILKTLLGILPTHDERYEPSHVICQNNHFLRLGITDCAILNIMSKDVPLLTVDLDLYLSATEGTAMNFNYLRQARLLSKE